MTDPVETVLPTLRALAWFAVIFLIAPRLVVRARDGERRDQYLARAACGMAVAVVVVVHALAIIGLLDAAALLMCFGAVAVGVHAHRTGTGVRQALMNALVSAQLSVYDFLDADRGGLKGTGARVIARVGDAARRGGQRAVSLAKRHPALVVVLAMVIGIRLWLLAAYPYPDSPTEHAHVMALKGLMQGDVVAEGYTPLGAHAVTLLFHQIGRVDEVLVWRVAGTLWAALAVLLSYVVVAWASDRPARKLGAPALAAAFVALGQLVPLAEHADPAASGPADLASLLLLAAVAFTALSLRTRRPLLPMLMGLALAFVHPIGWALAFFGIMLAMAGVVVSQQAAVRPAARTVLGVALAAAPVGLLWLVGTLNGGPGPSPEGGAATIAATPVGEALFWIAGVSAVGLLVLGRRRGEASDGRAWAPLGHALALTFLAGWGLARLDLVEIHGALARSHVEPLLVPVGGAVTALLTGRLRDLARGVRLQRLADVATLGAIAISALLMMALQQPARAHVEPADVLAQVYELKDRFRGEAWTVVGHPHLETHVAGRGETLTRAEFLRRFDPQQYRWDPTQPELALASAHTFLVVERQTPDIVYASADAAAVRAEDNAGLDRWCQTYMRSNDDMNVEHESATVRIYHLYRSPADERAIIDRMQARGVSWVDHATKPTPPRRAKTRPLAKEPPA